MLPFFSPLYFKFRYFINYLSAVKNTKPNNKNMMKSSNKNGNWSLDWA